MWSKSRDPLSYGVGMGFLIPPSHSLWGTEVVFGGGHELVLNPSIISFYMPIKYAIGESKDLFLTFDPALLMGWVTGTYTGSTTLNFSPSPGFGFGAAVGLRALFLELYRAQSQGRISAPQNKSRLFLIVELDRVQTTEYRQRRSRQGGLRRCLYRLWNWSTLF